MTRNRHDDGWRTVPAPLPSPEARHPETASRHTAGGRPVRNGLRTDRSRWAR